MDTIKAKVTFNEDSHLAAFRLHMWHRYQVWLMLRTFLSIAVLLAGIILLISQGTNPMAILMLMGTMLLFMAATARLVTEVFSCGPCVAGQNQGQHEKQLYPNTFFYKQTTILHST